MSCVYFYGQVVQGHHLHQTYKIISYVNDALMVTDMTTEPVPPRIIRLNKYKNTERPEVSLCEAPSLYPGTVAKGCLPSVLAAAP